MYMNRNNMLGYYDLVVLVIILINFRFYEKDKILNNGENKIKNNIDLVILIN